MLANSDAQSLVVVYILFVIAAYLFGAFLRARISGWHKLAQVYPDTGTDSMHRTKLGHFAGQIGRGFFQTRYTIHVSCSTKGMALGAFLLYRPFHPPIFLPWSALTNVEEKARFFGLFGYRRYTVEGVKITFSRSSMAKVDAHIPAEVRGQISSN